MASVPPISGPTAYDRIRAPQNSGAPLGSVDKAAAQRGSVAPSDPNSPATPTTFEKIGFKRLGSANHAKEPSTGGRQISAPISTVHSDGEARQSYTLQTLSAIAGLLVGELDATAPAQPPATFAPSSGEAFESSRARDDKAKGDAQPIQPPGHHLDISI